MSSRKILKHHTAVTLAAAALVAAASIATASPAQATTTQPPCTVTPFKPSSVLYSSTTGKAVSADYTLFVSCWQNRTVQIEQQRYEEDWDSLWPFFKDADDYQGSTVFTRVMSANIGVTLHNRRSIVSTESGSEEIYHKVRIRSAAPGGTYSAWSSWERTPYVTVNA